MGKKLRKGICLFMLSISFAAFTACGSESDRNTEAEKTTTSNANQIEKETFHSEYQWTQVFKGVDVCPQYIGQGKQKHMIYGFLKIGVPILFDDENVSSVEYFIKDGNGTFMDQTDFVTLTTEQKEKRANGDYIRSEYGYKVAQEDQSGFYFSVYCMYEGSMDDHELIVIAQNQVRKNLIIANVKYKDGTTEQHQYAYDFIYDYNVTNAQIYELTEK